MPLLGMQRWLPQKGAHFAPQRVPTTNAFTQLAAKYQRYQRQEQSYSHFKSNYTRHTASVPSTFFINNYSSYTAATVLVGAAALLSLNWYNLAQAEEEKKESAVQDPLQLQRRLIILVDSLGLDPCLVNASQWTICAALRTQQAPLLVDYHVLQANVTSFERAVIKESTWEAYRITPSYFLFIPSSYDKLLTHQHGFDLERCEKLTNFDQYRSAHPCVAVGTRWAQILAKGIYNIDVINRVKSQLGDGLLESLRIILGSETKQQQFMWDIVMAGHSGDKEAHGPYFCGVREQAFKDILSFFDSKLKTHCFAFSGCWSSSHFDDVFGERLFHYPIFCIDGIQGFSKSCNGGKLFSDFGCQGILDSIVGRTDFSLDSFGAPDANACFRRVMAYDDTAIFVRPTNNGRFLPMNCGGRTRLVRTSSQCTTPSGEVVDAIYMDGPTITVPVSCKKLLAIAKSPVYYLEKINAQKTRAYTGSQQLNLLEKISAQATEAYTRRQQLINLFSYEHGFERLGKQHIFYVDTITFDDEEIYQVMVTMKGTGSQSVKYKIMYVDRDNVYHKIKGTKRNWLILSSTHEVSEGYKLRYQKTFSQAKQELLQEATK